MCVCVCVSVRIIPYLYLRRIIHINLIMFTKLSIYLPEFVQIYLRMFAICHNLSYLAFTYICLTVYSY